MTDDRTTDIAYVRALAEEGRAAPPVSGPFLVAAAVIFGLASVAQWAIQSGVVEVDPMAPLWVWLAAGAAFFLTLFPLSRRSRRLPGGQSLRNEAVNTAWSGIGFLIFTVWLSLTAMGLLRGEWEAMRIMPSLVFAAYGAAWTVAAAMNRARWMNGVALASFAGAVAVAAVADRPVVYLVFAALLVLIALVPGLHLTRREGRAAA